MIFCVWMKWDSITRNGLNLKRLWWGERSFSVFRLTIQKQDFNSFEDEVFPDTNFVPGMVSDPNKRVNSSPCSTPVSSPFYSVYSLQK